MARTGCAFGNAICACDTARIPRQFSQVLPAYGLQDLRNEKPYPLKSSNPNTMCLKDTLGEDPGSGHFYLAKKRTFLLCVDMNPLEFRSRQAIELVTVPVNEVSDTCPVSRHPCKSLSREKRSCPLARLGERATLRHGKFHSPQMCLSAMIPAFAEPDIHSLS